MRLIAGKFKGRLLNRPDERIARPTTDRNREALFNILSHSPHVTLAGAVVLDVFAGSGALGLEALSRGAQKVFFVEHHPAVIRVLRQNIDALGCHDQAVLLAVDAHKLPQAPEPVDLVFMDPPYRQELEAATLAALRQKGWLQTATLIVVESHSKDTLNLPPSFVLIDQRIYGNSAFHFYKQAS